MMACMAVKRREKGKIRGEGRGGGSEAPSTTMMTIAYSAFLPSLSRWSTFQFLVARPP